MPPNQPPPVEVRIHKVRNIRPYDTTVAKAVAEAATDALAALFRTGSRRRSFRIVTGTPAEGGIEVEAAIHELALGAPRENAAMLTFTVVLDARTVRGRPVESGRLEGHASIDVAANPVPQAIRIMAAAVARGAERFVRDCERMTER